jgi:hypothetical protein
MDIAPSGAVRLAGRPRCINRRYPGPIVGSAVTAPHKLFIVPRCDGASRLVSRWRMCSPYTFRRAIAKRWNRLLPLAGCP